MKKCFFHIPALIALGAVFLFPAVTMADTLGATGVIRSITLNASTSNDYVLYHGNVRIESKVDTVHSYWGGAYCPGLSLFSDESRFVLEALIDFSQTQARVRPAFKVGQGGNLCLVAVTAAAKK